MHNRNSYLSRRWPMLSLFLSSLLLSSWVAAAVPHLIRYQGFLKDSQSVPLEGPYTLTFRLYPAESGGTAVWVEPQSNVPVSQGSFSVLLGQDTSLDSVDWGSPLWISMQVNAEAELAPRQQITSVPLALRAESAEKLTQAITPSLINPQGSGSSLDADTVDGKHAVDLLNRANHTGTQASSTITGTFTPSAISPQGQGSGMNADLLDGQDSSAFATAGHKHACVNRMGMPPGQSGNSFCAGYGEWCVIDLTASGRDTNSCTAVNPSFSDWGAVCCR